MKLLMISTDRGLLDPTSRVSERFRTYAPLFDELHVIVFSVGQLEIVSLAPNVHIYPTNSSSKLRYIADATRIGRGIKADVVSGQDPFETGLTAYRIARIHKAKLHLQVHTDLFSEAFVMQSGLNRVRLFIAKWLLPKALGIRVVSKRIAHSIKNNLPGRTVEPIVLPIVVMRPESVTPMQFPFAQTVLMVCRLEAEKQVKIAIDGFLKLSVDHPDVGLVIVGDGRQRTELELYVFEQGIANQVQFLGARSDVFDLYAGADVYLQTSLYEGYGMTLIEAALSGLPIVTTDVGIVGEVLIDGGSVLVTQATPVDIAMKLGILLDDEALRQMLGGRAQESAEVHVMGGKAYLDAFRNTFTI
jgi:glycosyltransferase involved in cell wall biosynthesis